MLPSPVQLMSGRTATLSRRRGTQCTRGAAPGHPPAPLPPAVERPSSRAKQHTACTSPSASRRRPARSRTPRCASCPRSPPSSTRAPWPLPPGSPRAGCPPTAVRRPGPPPSAARRGRSRSSPPTASGQSPQRARARPAAPHAGRRGAGRRLGAEPSRSSCGRRRRSPSPRPRGSCTRACSTPRSQGSARTPRPRCPRQRIGAGGPRRERGPKWRGASCRAAPGRLSSGKWSATRTHTPSAGPRTRRRLAGATAGSCTRRTLTGPAPWASSPPAPPPARHSGPSAAPAC
mmetsp:Transcript_38559/g.120443  ORF Transcript_38559/g.120443 Transcript_38559/m.120443 type:complete len:289 (+) Transcript_38559:100-966(+)